MNQPPDDRRYTREHEWVRSDGEVATIGITEFAQGELGDVTFVELPEVGRHLRAGEAFGVVESVKAVSDVYAPVSGEVTEVNPVLDEHPELLNQSPYDEAWLIRLRTTDPAEAGSLLDAKGYEAYLDETAH